MSAVDPTGTEMQRLRAEYDAKVAEITHRYAEARKFDAEASKYDREHWWYPVVVATGLVAGVATLTATLITLAVKFLAPGVVG